MRTPFVSTASPAEPALPMEAVWSRLTLDPQAWLADVLGPIADYPINRVDELLPWNITSAS